MNLSRLAVPLLVVALAGCTAQSGTGSGESRQDAVKDVCHQSVSDQLKSPSTAKFTDLEVYQAGANWYATGDVDSENSFGAMIRTGWTCTAKPTGGLNYNVKSTLVAP
jgi:hypothetical protein